MSINCSPQSLINGSASFQGVPDGRKLDLLIYVFEQIAQLNLTPQQLMDLSKCFVCIPPGRKLDVLNYIACQIAGGSSANVCITGGVGSPVGVVPVPCDFAAYVELPGPNKGLWLGDTVGSMNWSNVIAQGP